MKKLGYVLAALATLAVGVPTVASAEGFGVYIGGDRDYYGDRYYRDYRGPRAGSMNMIAVGTVAGITTTET